MSRLTLFVLMSFPIAWVSRASLRVPRCHGFYRFFAWEAILAVILLNEKHWLRDPFAEHQLVSWLMLAASLVLAILGMHMLLVVGRPRFTREDDVPRFGIEKTTT